MLAVRFEALLNGCMRHPSRSSRNVGNEPQRVRGRVESRLSPARAEMPLELDERDSVMKDLQNMAWLGESSALKTPVDVSNLHPARSAPAAGPSMRTVSSPLKGLAGNLLT